MARPPRLTALSHCAGCAAKLHASDLTEVLGGLKKMAKHRDALVGFATHDDAAVYRVAPGLAVVQTVDFFPPMVDDPYTFGQIAAANALSDIYAMGARPLFALNLVGFPAETLPLSTLRRILAGGQDKAAEAGIPILGGHSIDDAEPKYGLCVTGVVHPRRALRNAGARPGDALILTKPLGVGIVTTALKRGLADRALVKRAVAQMCELNRAAGEVFASGRFKVHALTDVTGFGLLGHLSEMMLGGKVRAAIALERIPILAGVPALAEQGVVPGGTRANLKHFSKYVRFPDGLPLAIRHVLADAQTNGGLLAAVPAKDVGRAVRALEKRGVLAAILGEVRRGSPRVDVLG